MSNQDENEPSYPQSKQECDEYCSRFVTALSDQLKHRLISVLLSGSWATGDAEPPKSDVDLTVVVDFIDDNLLDGLCTSWQKAQTGYANVYGLDEIAVMSHEALHMYTTNSVLLWGRNPFPVPTRLDFAADLAASTEVVARMTRNIVYAYWLTDDEIEGNLSYLLGKNCLRRVLQNLVAFRTGTYPRNKTEHRTFLKNSPEGEFIEWLEELSEEDKLIHYKTIARKLSLFSRIWFKEISNYRMATDD